jgi:hypothetical protein
LKEYPAKGDILPAAVVVALLVVIPAGDLLLILDPPRRKSIRNGHKYAPLRRRGCKAFKALTTVSTKHLVLS